MIWFMGCIPYPNFCAFHEKTGPILESEGMGAIFQKKGKEMLKKGKYLKIWAKIYKIQPLKFRC